MQFETNSVAPAKAFRRSSLLSRLLPIVAGATLAAFTILQSAPASADERINVVLDQAKVLQLPADTATIILGNPMVADVTMINGNTQLILTGKSYGQTNMIALDKKGNSVGESTVIVKAPEHGLLVQRGLVQETYSCEPKCQPTVRLGDNFQYSGQILGAAKAYEGAATANKR